MRRHRAAPTGTGRHGLRRPGRPSAISAYPQPKKSPVCRGHVDGTWRVRVMMAPGHTRSGRMDNSEWLADRFEEQRPHLRAVAYRMLGSLAEADDAVQDAWLRASRAGAGGIENLGGWLTTVVARVCLNMLRSRNTRREESLEALPDPVVSREGDPPPRRRRCWPTRSAWRSRWCWTRSPPPSGWRSCCTTCSACRSTRSRPWWGGPPEAARQLASRARRRVQEPEAPGPTGSRPQREVVDAFFAAARAGDLDALAAVLHPDVVLRVDFSPRRPAASRMSTARRPSPSRRDWGRTPPRSCFPCWSTAPRAC